MSKKKPKRSSRKLTKSEIGKVKVLWLRGLSINKIIKRIGLNLDTRKVGLGEMKGTDWIEKLRVNKKVITFKVNPHPRVRYKGKEYVLSDIPIKDLKRSYPAAEISLVVGVIIIILIIWGVYTYGDK